MNSNRIVEIEEVQSGLRNKAEEAQQKGDFYLHSILHALAGFLESDKLFINSPELLEVYSRALVDKIELSGMKWPITLPISSTSNETLSDTTWWETTGGQKVLRYFQDFVIDAVVDITGLNDDELTEDGRLFLTFLSEIKLKGFHRHIEYCEYLVKRIVMYAASDNLREKVYKDSLFIELAVELAESFSEVKKIHAAKVNK